MNIELFGKINGYLNGIADINSWGGCCYTWIFSFREYKYLYDIKECIQMFIEDSYFGHRDDINILGLEEVENWEEAIFNTSSEWFFNTFELHNISPKYEDENGAVTPLVKHKEYNFVSDRLIKDLIEFFENIEVKVFKLIIEPTYIDEFGWEQYFFDCGKVAYILSFYQQG